MPALISTESSRTSRTASTAPRHPAGEAGASGQPSRGVWMARLVLPSAVITPLSTCGFSQRTCGRSEVSIQRVAPAISQ